MKQAKVLNEIEIRKLIKVCELKDTQNATD